MKGILKASVVLFIFTRTYGAGPLAPAVAACLSTPGCATGLFVALGIGAGATNMAQEGLQKEDQGFPSESVQTNLLLQTALNSSTALTAGLPFLLGNKLFAKQEGSGQAEEQDVEIKDEILEAGIRVGAYVMGGGEAELQIDEILNDTPEEEVPPQNDAEKTEDHKALEEKYARPLTPEQVQDILVATKEGKIREQEIWGALGIKKPRPGSPLGLSDEKRAKIQEIREEALRKLREINNLRVADLSPQELVLQSALDFDPVLVEILPFLLLKRASILLAAQEGSGEEDGDEGDKDACAESSDERRKESLRSIVEIIAYTPKVEKIVDKVPEADVPTMDDADKTDEHRKLEEKYKRPLTPKQVKKILKAQQKEEALKQKIYEKLGIKPKTKTAEEQRADRENREAIALLQKRWKVLRDLSK